MANDKMTPKAFFKKMNSKAAASALGFIAAHREYMLNGELSEVVKPILDRVDSGDMMPTPALNELKLVVAGHLINAEKEKADKAIERASRQSRGPSKPFEAMVLDALGRILVDDKGEDMRKTFEKPQEAQRWADRRLVEYPNTIGEVLHNGAPWETIERDDAIARIFRKAKTPFMKRRPSPGSLGTGMKVKGTKVTFSNG